MYREKNTSVTVELCLSVSNPKLITKHCKALPLTRIKSTCTHDQHTDCTLHTSLSVMVTGAGSVVCLSTAVFLLVDADGGTAGVEAAAGSFFITITPLAALDTEDCRESRVRCMNNRRWQHVVRLRQRVKEGTNGGPVDQDKSTAGPGFCPGSPSASASPHEAASAPPAAASASPRTASP